MQRLEPDETEPDETDLLIRSISSLLYSLWPYTPQTTRADSTHSLAFLNNVALLFVSGARNDCAAVATFVHKNSVHVEAIQEPPHEPDQSQLRVVRNVKTRVLKQVRDESPLDTLRKELLSDPAWFCFTKGLDAITPKLHGNVLQDLLTKMYGVDASNRPQEAAEILISYLVCFGIRKMRRRLNTKLNETTLPYIRLLTCSSISREDFLARRTKIKVKLPQKLENADERLLKTAWEEGSRDTEVAIVQKGESSFQLSLPGDQEWNLWGWFKTLLGTLEKLTSALEEVVKGKMRVQRSNEHTLRVLPVEIFKILGSLHLLANDSPTFWTIMEQREELISSVSRHLVEDLKTEQGLHNSPPTPAPPQEGGGTSQQATEGYADVESSDAETDYSAWHDTQFEDDEIRSGAQTPEARRLSNFAVPGHTQHEEPGRGLSSSIREIRRWLVLLTEWYQAIQYLLDPSVATSFLNKSLTIHVEVAPQPLAPTRQASLRSTVDSLLFEAGSLLSETDSDRRLELIIARAQAKFPNHNRKAGDAISVLLNASPTNDETLRGWETKFKGTSVHCEALLACNLKAQNATNMSIGISKRCCFCCAAVLQHLGFKDKHIGRHGKVYPWSPPLGADVGTKEAVLHSLKDQLADCLRTQYEGHRTGDSGPISSKGSPRNLIQVPVISNRKLPSAEYMSELEALLSVEDEPVAV
ncbi:hypothetical protein M407DRAFT_243656 [Tulasnella calospora MUT 4182]|uniref:Uncharacterized protein n=1 Tax=Tulasnella calospora MUT 4182 TaxID=1051891 RepID=A0A0C3Q9H2_9AGAM|nr:hypothetical protein M407DRAFT_243656 [Tulasnella calospora MUT 4182]